MKSQMTRWALAGIAGFAFSGCSNGLAQVDVTTTHVTTFPGPPAALQGRSLPTEMTTTDGYVTIDMKKDLSSLSNMGVLTAGVSRNTLAGPDLSFIRHITATISAEDGKMPVEVASEVDVPEGATETEMALLIGDARLLEYLSEGKVDVHFYITGNIPPRPVTLTHTMVAHLSVAMNGSVLKF